MNRQQSWGAPTQSNSFRVIQKITNTDADDDEDEQPVEQMPRQAQQMPMDQMRKMNLNQGDRDLMNKFRQGKRHMHNIFLLSNTPRNTASTQFVKKAQAHLIKAFMFTVYFETEASIQLTPLMFSYVK